MITIYGEISKVPTSKAQQLDACVETQNEINQLEIKKLIDKDFSGIKSINWRHTDDVKLLLSV